MRKVNIFCKKLKVFNKIIVLHLLLTTFAYGVGSNLENKLIDSKIKTHPMIPTISGIILVPGMYPSLTNTGGAFEAINAGIVTGNITINITADLAGEMGTFSLQEFASPYTILIKPTASPRTITGANSGALIKLLGADRVTIDGSTSGASTTACLVGGNAALRSLTIQNTNASMGAIVISFGSGTNGAQNNTIKNVNVLGQSSLLTLCGIALGGSVPGTSGIDNDNNRVENCSIKRAIFGIYSGGASLMNQNNGTVVTNNDLSALSIDRIKRMGIFVVNENGIQVSYNSVGGVDNSGETADAIGIGVGTQEVSNTFSTGGGITNAIINNNKVSSVSQDATYSAVGIALAGDTGGANTISNNMVSGVISDGTSPDISVGIFISGVTGSNTRLYYNSVSMTGNRSALLTPATSQSPSFGIAITGADPVLELKNNIFYNTQTADFLVNQAAKSYAIGMVSTTFVNLNSNYNEFWSTGTNDGGFRTGSLGTASGTDYATWALWLVAVNDDVNSLEIDPVFTNPSNDLHIPVNVLASAGIPIVGITDDVDCNVRSLTTPAIGAHSPACGTVVSSSVDGLSVGGNLRNLLACIADGTNITFDVGVPTSFMTSPLLINKNVTLQGIATLDFDFSAPGFSSGPYGFRVAASKTVILNNINVIDRNNTNSIPPSVFPVITVRGTLITNGSTTITKL